MEVGDMAPYAHQNVRQFPDWYKPYGFNYQGDGWLALILGGCFLFGWAYLNDIKEQKGRKSRKVYPLQREGLKSWSSVSQHRWAKERVEKGDQHFAKFMEKKERAAVHH